MSAITAENILKLIEQLPSTERIRLNQLLGQRDPAPAKTKPPLQGR